MNPIYSLIELRQSHHYYHHFSTLMVLLVYGYLVYLIAAALTITFLYLLSCKAIAHTRIVALVLFPRWYTRLVCVELYQWLIELERIFILPLAPRWVRHSYLSKRLHTIPYTCGISAMKNSSPHGWDLTSWQKWYQEELIDYKTRKRGKTRVTRGIQSSYDGSTHRRNKAIKEFFLFMTLWIQNMRP
jgi:hypothetical protein